MSVILKLTFPAGRYHATPWGRHVNEGVPEWPPSPWRLLRALVAVWKRTVPGLPEAQVRRILEPLLQPPLFQLPAFRVAHTRHYMPWEKKGPADRTLVFDTFVALSRSDPVVVGWPDADLADDDRAALGGLVGNLATLGRAEGWVQAELGHGTADWNCRPNSDGAGDGVPVFCPDPASALGDEHYPRPTPPQVRRGLRPGELLFDCPRWHLCLDTQTVHESKWPTVPGGRWVHYGRPESGGRGLGSGDRGQESGGRGQGGGRSVRIPQPSARRAPTVARFLLDGPVLPPVTDTVRVAEAFRHRLLGRFKGVVCRRLGLPADADPRTDPAVRSGVLSGKADGRPAVGGHDHAYYLPTDEDADGRIDHLTVVAAGGLGADEVAALTGVRGVRVRELDLRAQLVGLGRPADFRCPLFAESRVWVSATPFVVTRHLKRRGTKRDPAEWFTPAGRGAFVTAVAAAEWARRPADGAEVPAIERIEPAEVRARLGWRHAPWEFRRGRSKPGDDGMGRPHAALRLQFERPVAGPISLGYAAHFGLGQFVPTAG